MIIPVIICIGIIAFLLIPSGPDDTTVTESGAASAQLVIGSGVVQVKSSDGIWTDGENGTLLYQSDIVKTGDNSSASIILFETSVVRLDSNTEIAIKELIDDEETSVTLSQDSGRTWNTVSKMSGIDNYEVQTPTTVASVRGTAFDVYILANGNITISVGNGTVNVTTYEDGEAKHSIEVPQFISVTVDPQNLGDPPGTEPYTEDEWIIKNLQEDEDIRNSIREEIYERVDPFLSELKELYGMTDEELEALIEGYILGYWTLPDDSPQWARDLFEFT